jgi:hypothetical protein
MKPHLVSSEILARQVYRYSPAYRFAAFALFSFLVLQVPVVVWVVCQLPAVKPWACSDTCQADQVKKA